MLHTHTYTIATIFTSTCKVLLDILLKLSLNWLSPYAKWYSSNRICFKHSSFRLNHLSHGCSRLRQFTPQKQSFYRSSFSVTLSRVQKLNPEIIFPSAVEGFLLRYQMQNFIQQLQNEYSIANYPELVARIILQILFGSFVVPAHGSTASGYWGTQRDVQGSDGPDASGTFHDLDKSVPPSSPVLLPSAFA